ncbi:MAG TPA: amino acid adenylation domain-containing protein [Labilithrix sp.]|nr:amino acid adenylation domain-containing protein [Labilithrix sp.]
MYTIGGYKKLTGAVDVGLLRRCAERVLNGTDICHLRFREENGVVFMRVERRELAVSILDFTTEADPTAACLAWMQADFERPFPREVGPFVSVVLLRASESITYVYSKAHHIILDGWAFSQLGEQILVEYANATVASPKVASPRPSYLAFAQEEARYVGSSDWEADRAYWRKALDGLEPRLFIRKPAPGMPQGIYRSGRHSVVLPSAQAERLREVSRAHRVSSFNVVSGVLAAYLGRVHGATDIVLGVPFLNRTNGAQLQTMGQFANVLPLRVDVDRARPFIEIVRSLRASTDQATKHQRLSLGDMLRALPTPFEGNRRPFDVTLSYQPLSKGSEIAGVSVESVALTHGYEQEALAIFVRESGASRELIIDIHYALDVYDADLSISGMAGHFETLLDASLSSLEVPVRSLPWMRPEERKVVVEEWNDTAADYKKDATIIGLFEKQVARRPEAAALSWGSDANGTRTYAELDEQANQLAHALRARGAGPDERVAVVLERGPEMMVALYGVLKAGAAYVPIDPGYPEERIRYLLEDSRAKVVLSRTDLAAKRGITGETLLLVDALPSQSAERVAPSATSRDLAYVIYTSGSTGKPKGAMIEHHSVVNRLAWMQKRYPIGAGDVILQKTPISFDVSVWELFWWAIEGASVALLGPGDEKDPIELVRAIARHGVTVMHFVPSMLGPFLDVLESEPALARATATLRTVFCSGEALPPTLVNRFNRIFHAQRGGGETPKLVNLYGPTEATVDVSYFDCPTAADSVVTRVPIGKPIDNIQLYVVDPDGQSQPVGVPGELCIAGVGLARGYLERPELTAQKFVENPFEPSTRMYRTGDLARWLADGNIEYLGRIDEQVKIRGNRVELGEVQHCLATFPGVQAAVVVDREQPGSGKYLCGYYVSDTEISADALRAHFLERVPEFMLPAHFVRIDRIPLTPNGKADRRALPAPEAAVRASSTREAPRTPLEESLVAVWEKVLDTKIGIFDNFFVVGGDSIRMVQATSEVRKLGIDLSLRDTMAHPTVAALAAHILRSQASQAADGAPSGASEDAGVVVSLDPFALTSSVDREKLTEAEAEDAFPITRLQLGMLFHSREKESSAVYHDVFRYTLAIAWDEAAFRASVDKLVARHPVLRSSFDLGRYSEPLQIVHRHVDGGLEVVDVRGAADAEQSVAAHIEERRHHRYVFERAPLHHFRVFVHSSEIDLVFSFHHASLDGWSVASLVRELVQDYLHLIGAAVDAVVEASVSSPAAYVAEEQRALASEASRRFWLDKLAGAECVTLDGFRAHEPKGDDGLLVRRVFFSEDLEDAVRGMSRAHGIPVKSILLTAHVLTLRLLSGKSDVTTGLVTHGRLEREDAERMVGLFLNTIPVRYNEEGASFVDVARAVYREEQATYEHRRYPISQIQQDRGGQSIFETAFNYVHFHLFAPLLRVAGAELAKFEVREETNFQVLVNAVVDPRDGRMSLRIDCDGRSFSSSQADLLARYYEAILRRMATAPTAAVDFGFLTEGSSFGAAGASHDVDVVRLFDAQVARTPSAIALAFEGREWTYEELHARATAIAQKLVLTGVRLGDRVALAMDRSPELVASVIGVLKAGAACVPLDVSYPAARLAAMLAQAKPSCALVHETYVSLVPDTTQRIDIATISPSPETEHETTLPDIRPDTVAYVLFTSGSTGQPKGVMLPHRALGNLVGWQNSEESGATGGKTLQFAPVGFDVSFQEIFSTLAGGGTLQLVSEAERRDTAALLRLMDREGVERAFFPYVALQQLAETGTALGIAPSKLRVLASSGEQLRVTDEIRRFCASLPRACILENQYGPTESHVVTRFTMRGDPALWPSLPPIGTSIDGASVFVLDGALRPVPVGGVGELYLGGVCLAHGYDGQPEMTAERFIQHPLSQGDGRLYRSGDLGRVLPNGAIVCLGRADTQVKVRGFRVETAEVEVAIRRAVEAQGGVRDVAVVAHKRSETDSFLVAFLVAETTPIDTGGLSEELRKVLPEYMVPRHFEWISELPRTPSGKRDDGALRSRPLTRTGTSAEKVAPRDEAERALAELVAGLLQVPSVGVHDDFFELGGTSLTAVRLVVMLETRFGMNVPLSAFIAAPTVAQLAERMRSKDAPAKFNPLVPLSREGSGRPVFFAHPIGGNVLCYVRLAKYIGKDRPLYALQASGVEAGSSPVETVEAMAQAYVEAIRAVQPEGPYTLGGWSFGGYLAFEMARQLREAGEVVDHLVLLDSIALSGEGTGAVGEDMLMTWFFWELLWGDRGSNADPEPIPAELVTEEAKLDYILACATEAGILPQGSSGEHVKRLYQVFKSNWVALLKYRPRTIAQDITLLRASEPLPDVLAPAHHAAGSMYYDPTNGWGPLTTGRLMLIDVPGDHLRIMEEPNIVTLASEVRNVLARPLEDSSSAPTSSKASSPRPVQRAAKKAVVVGAGIGGLTTAIALRRIGMEVEVYERARELRAAGTGLSIMSNAITALRTIGVEGVLERHGQVLESFELRSDDDRWMTRMPFKEVGEKLGAPSVCIHRAALQKALLELAGDCPIHLASQCAGIASEGARTRVRFEDGREVVADLVVGADGIHSAVRRELVGAETVCEAGYVCWLATVAYRHSRHRPGHVRHYWGPGTRFGVIDIGHGQTYWFGTKNLPKHEARASRGTKEEILRTYAGWPDEVQALIQETPESAVVSVPAMDRKELRRWSYGAVTLLGDAAHPMLTSLGQGAGMAIEDAVVLGQSLERTSDIPEALRAYEARRIPRTTQVARLSRTLSKVEQWEHGLPCRLRDAWFRWLPTPAWFSQNESLLRFE